MVLTKSNCCCQHHTPTPVDLFETTNSPAVLLPTSRRGCCCGNNDNNAPYISKCLSPAESNKGSWMLIRPFSDSFVLSSQYILISLLSLLLLLDHKHWKYTISTSAAEKVEKLPVSVCVCAHVCVCRSVCVKPLSECDPLCEQGWDGAGWHSAELHGKESGVLCLWTQTSVGQTGFDRRHHRQKNNKIRNHPSHSLPAHPSSASCPWTHLCTSPSVLSFQFSSALFHSLLPTFPLALHLCSLIQHHLLFSTLQTNYPTNSLSALLSQIFLNSFLHHHIHCLPSIYLAFSQTDGLLVTQQICPCKREYVRSALHMLGLNSTFSLSRESRWSSL